MLQELCHPQTMPIQPSLKRVFEFSVLVPDEFKRVQQQDAPDEFKRVQQQERDKQYDIFMGATQIPDQEQQDTEEEEDHHEAADDKENEEGDDEEDNLWDLIQDDGPARDDDPTQDEDNPNYDEHYNRDDDEEERPVEPRAFLIVWNALSQWVTPQAYKPDDSWIPPTFPHTDCVVASRCAGLMFVMQMHAPHCLEHLHAP
jgi:hypothetical protein